MQPVPEDWHGEASVFEWGGGGVWTDNLQALGWEIRQKQGTTIHLILFIFLFFFILFFYQCDHARLYVCTVVCSLLKVMLMKSFSSISRKSYSVHFSECACTGMYSAECIMLCVHTIIILTFRSGSLAVSSWREYCWWAGKRSNIQDN